MTNSRKPRSSPAQDRRPKTQPVARTRPDSQAKPYAARGGARDHAAVPQVAQMQQKIATTASEDHAEDANLWQQVTWFEVSEHQEGQRLDNFLMTRLKGVPKTRIYRLIREGEVRVNKGRVRADTRLQIGDQIRVAPIRRHVKSENDVTTAVISDDLAQGLLARVVYEDDGLLVVNKPAGIAVHGGSGVAFGVIEAIRQATQKSYLELVHRIDRDTSGLLMIAKKRSTLKKLQDDLREGRIRKTYHALVKGHVLLDRQMIDAPLLRYELANGERRVKIAADGKPSQTDWRVLERFEHATWVEASPLTGRTHQIRVHGLSIGHPLLGDDKYGHDKPDHGIKPRRLCLHATRLSIPDYPIIEAPVAEDIQQVMDDLRKPKAKSVSTPKPISHTVKELQPTSKSAPQKAAKKPVQSNIPTATNFTWHPDMDD